MKLTYRSVSILVSVVLFLTLAGPSAAAHPAGPPRAQPVLFHLAAAAPEQMVTVIVQKTAQGNAAEQAAGSLGGRVLRSLEIIRAFTARLTASAALRLARDPAVRWVSLDAAVWETGCSDCISSSNLKSAYIRSIRADKVWSQSGFPQGRNVGVAVLDSGVNPQTDLYTVYGDDRLVAAVNFNTDDNQTPYDNYGHGSHVAGVIGGNGRSYNGYYIGVAPQSNIINVKVSNDDGSAYMSSVIAGMQWILENKDNYNIRVVNISMNSAEMESYNTSPFDAAAEVLWFNGIVVVVSAGNTGTGGFYPPANDPFVITVGATDDKGTASVSDDVVASFSAYGKTDDGFKKPDLVAPGKNIISLMGNSNGVLPTEHPENIIKGGYFKMSGTSVSAPVVAGTVALLLEDEPNLTPDQVKYRLMATANKTWAGYTSTKAGYGIVDAYAAVNGTSTASANTGTNLSQMLFTGDEPVSSSVAWNSVAWNSVAWNSVAWNSVAWNSVAWNSDYWGK